jgi:hypothetical protein
MICRMVVVALLLALAAPAFAADARLARRLDPATAEEITRVVTQAKAAGLPTDPLVATALEGASRHAPASQILAAVHRQADEFERSRAVLGPRASHAAIIAGASVLHAGVSADTLARLCATRPGRSFVIPMVVLADLVARGVPSVTATATVETAVRTGARDTELLRLRERVAQDILRGASPGDATALRARALMLDLTAPTRGTRSDREQLTLPTPGIPPQ